MLEEYDPYFANFVQDLGYCISLVFQTIRVVFGVSYLVVSKIGESFAWILWAMANGYQEIATVWNVIMDEFTEFVAAFVRAILLIYYGAHKVVESFYIAAVDIQDFYHHFTESLQQTAIYTGNFILSCLIGIFTKVPQQIVAALSMVGDSTILVKDGMIYILRDFIQKLFWSPINVVIVAARTAFALIIIPINILRNMPSSSLLGLLVLILAAFVFRRLIRYLILQNILAIFKGLWSFVVRVLSFIGVTQIRKFLTFSVSTLTHLRDSNSYSSGNCKGICVICQDKPVTFMSNPCKHVCLCDGCVRDLVEHDSRCPICRSQVTKYDRVFIP